jgi:hypothetical protein
MWHKSVRLLSIAMLGVVLALTPGDASSQAKPDTGEGGGGGGATCAAGGAGASSCSIETIGVSCSVSCNPGYMACCNVLGGCKCLPN